MGKIVGKENQFDGMATQMSVERMSSGAGAGDWEAQCAHKKACDFSHDIKVATEAAIVDSVSPTLGVSGSISSLSKIIGAASEMPLKRRREFLSLLRSSILEAAELVQVASENGRKIRDAEQANLEKAAKIIGGRDED